MSKANTEDITVSSMKGILNNLHYLVVFEVVYSTMLFSIIAKSTHDFWLKIQESILREHSTVIISVGRSIKTVKLVVWRFHRKCGTAHVGHLKDPEKNNLLDF